MNKNFNDDATIGNGNEEKEFKILSIDGGGIKGLYSATVLRHIEERFDCHLTDHFDLICGTSTGGLIALALSLRRSAKEIADFYAERGESIFPYTSWLARKFAFLKQIAWGGKYSDRILRSCLEEFLGPDTHMDNANTLLCIPSFNLTTGEPIVFKKPHGNFYRDGNLKMVDVALATSAAPTYFPIVKFDYPNLKGLFVDGGVWANNPTLCGVLEALNYFVGEGKEFSSYSVLSIASVSQPNGWRMQVERNRSFARWGNKLFQSSFDGQNFFTDFLTKKIVPCTTPKGRYFRIPSPSQLSKDHCKDIDMDKAGVASINILKSLGDTQGSYYTTIPEYRRQLEIFFEQKKHSLTI